MNRIRELRLNRGLTQIQLASMCNITQGTLSSYESGRHDPDIPMLSQMADIFGVSLDYISGRTDDPTPAGSSLREQMSDIQFALSGEIHDLTDDEMRDILDYVRFKRAQRRKDGK